MRTAALGIVVAVAVGVLATWAYARVTGLRARVAPVPMEAALARTVRAWSIPSADRRRENPVVADAASLRNGREHYADHCASCHANDGSGNTELGRSLFPPAPDMRLRATQQLSDGELFYIIEHGIRFTGMPAWSTGTAAGERASWELVNFVRHLPALGADELEEMAGMNPRSPAEIRQEIEAEQFLQGN